MAQGTIQLLKPTVSVILIEGYTIPVDNIAFAGPVNVIPEGTSYAVPNERTVPAYRVRLKSGGHIDLHDITADGFASLLAGAAF